jgi:hypothetical protein
MIYYLEKMETTGYSGDVGNDILRGGAGANESVCGDGVDTVLDYDPAKGDVISNDCEIVNTPG